MKIANTLMMLLLLALVAENSLGASYDDYQRYRKGTYDFELETQYFKTDANYLSSGDSYQRLPYGQSYELWNLYLKARYDLTKKSSWYGNLNIATANSAGLDAKRSNSSLADATVGYAYMPYTDDFDVVTDFNVVIPFNKISINTDSAMNSEGVIEATGLLRLQQEFSMVAPFGYIGATYRQDRSALLPWGAGLELRFYMWTLGGKVFGYQSILDDPDKNNKTQRLIVNDRVNAGSLKFYAVNPSLIDSEVYAKIKVFRNWTLSVGAGTTVTGSATAAGLHAGANLTYTWDSQPSYYLHKDTGTSEDALSSEKKVPRFKEEINDGVDQKIFEKKPAPKPSPPRSENEIAPATENVAIKRIAPKPGNTPEVQDGGEVKLKLKRKKKRS
jgi:hypothetical protein